MTPNPHELSGAMKVKNEACPPGEEIVISGLSGLFPDCYNVKELSHVLYNKINPITNKNLRWNYNHPEVPDCTGKVPDLEFFDAQFFKVHYRLAKCMDPVSRKILEQSYQAIYDAGLNCGDLSGKKVGVYIGNSFSETEKVCFFAQNINSSLGLTGCSKSMFANRISYWLNSKGPSVTVNQACCSSSVALELAYHAMKRGDCEAALVGGCTLCLHPHSFIHNSRIMSLSMDGKTKSFDQNGCGCAKSDAIGVLFLQKAKDANRIYAELVHVKSKFTSPLEGKEGPRYDFYRNPTEVANFWKEFYSEAKVPPQEIEYVEAFGSGMLEADESELKAIDEVFCKGRSKPLPIGSVMSNIGYGEAACGVSSITKVLLGFEKGEFAGNLNLETPRNDVEAVRDGRIKVITDHLPTNNGYVAVNTFSITGSNTHVLLKGHFKPKDITRYKSSIPRLVTISARQDSALQKIFADLKSRPVDPEELALLHNIHQAPVAGHLGRGYLILDTNEANETVTLSEKCEYFDNTVRPLWFVYSGMGSQWAGMGTQLMRIPVFAAAIEKCRRVLEPKGVDIVDIITSPDKSTFDNILNSFVGIAAIQIGLTDVLTSIGIIPDKIIGHSVGELGCAYADGCFTAEEMILSAYSRGLVSLQTPFIRGSMAAVGVGFTEISKLCPPEIAVACHNGPESCTISGPAEAMKEFVATLTAKNIFAKEVPCSNIAYHSRYIAEAGPSLRQYLSEVIKDPKPRSDRWLSTSVPEINWKEELAKYSSAEYHTNNLLNPVLFEETSRHIPADAVLIEIAPHGLLQAILKRSLPESCKNIYLTRRRHHDNVRLVLEAIGQLFMEGYNPKIQALYPKVEFPVSTGTPMLSHQVEWAHTETWSLWLFKTDDYKKAAACRFIISLHDDEHEFLRGHVMKGVNVYPFAGALTYVWDTLCMVDGVRRRSQSVRFRDVHFMVQPLLSENNQLSINVTLHRGSGRFEVSSNTTEIMTGYITWNSDGASNANTTIDEELTLSSDDIYKLLKIKEYKYSGDFQSIRQASTSLSQAKIEWKKNWVTLIDGLIQLNMLKKSEGVSELEFIRQIDLNVDEMPEDEVDSALVDACVSDVLEVSRCSKVSFHDVRFRSRPVSNEGVSAKAYKFVPHFPKEQSNEAKALSVFFQIISENVNRSTINALIVNESGCKYSGLKSITEQIHGVKVNLASIQKNDLLRLIQIDNEIDVLLLNELSFDESLTKAINNILPSDFFIINKEFSEPKHRPTYLYNPVSTHKTANAQIQLIRWRPAQLRSISSAVTVHSTEDLVLLKSSLSLLPPGQNLLIVSTYPKVPGLTELVKQWSKASIGSTKKIYMIEVKDKISSEQYLSELPPLNLIFNVIDHGTWGGKYFLPVEFQKGIEGNAILQIANVGDIDTLSWVEGPELTAPGIIVKVHYSTLNCLDTKRSMGEIPIDFNSDLNFGMDFSGVTESGVRVMGLVKSGSVSTTVRAKSEQLWPVPAHWTLEDAATVPLAYCMAFYCLTSKSRLLPGMKILVHGGTGALGQAVISIALAFDCEVFTTVSDLKKKHFLKKLFPQLKEEHIGNSRNHSFGDMVRAGTNGKGCDIIISCANKEFKNTSIGCLGEHGVYYDISLLLEQENFTLGMNNFSKCRSYATIDIRSIFETENDMKRLQVLVSEGIARGYVRPLTRVVYPPSDVTRAFRLLAASRHRGRVLLDMQQPIPAVTPRLKISSDACNVVISDDDVLAMQLADKLVSQGAKQLYIQAPYSNAFLVKQRSWQDSGVHTVIDRHELWNENYVEFLLNKSSALGNVEVIYLIVHKSQKYDDVTKYLGTLNSAAEKRMPTIKHIAVIDVGNRIGDDELTPPSASKHNLTIVKSPELESVQGSLSFKSVLKVLQVALNSKETVIVVQPLPEKKSLLEEIATIAKIDLPKTLEGSVTLKELCKDPAALLPVRGYLRDQYHILLSEEDIQDLTVDKIKNIEESTMDTTVHQSVEGFAQFYSYVVDDELQSTTEMVFLPTIMRSATVQDCQFDTNEKFLCLIPGLEGHNKRFKLLVERLKLQALIMQPDLAHTDETPEELAARFTKTLVKRTGIKGHFYLLGYETGVIVALKMAKILEEQGLTGTVFCLGGTPQDILSEVNHVLDQYKSEEELQDDLIRHMLRLHLGEENAHIKLKGSWEEKVSTYVHYLTGKVPVSSQYNQDYLRCAYSRMKQIQKCKFQPTPLRSQVIFLKSKLAVRSRDSPQQYSEKPVVVYNLETPLGNVARDLRCTAIVNRHLEPQVLKDFNEANLCFAYSCNIFYSDF